MAGETAKLESLIKEELKKVPEDAVFTMSGGVDSGVLCALAKQMNSKLPKAVVTVHLPYGEKFDEFESAK